MIIDAMHLYSAATEIESAVSVAEFSLDQAAISEPYILLSAFGLDVDEVIPQFYGVYSSDAFYNMALKAREVVLSIKLNPQYGTAETNSSLRDALYKVIARNRTGLVELRLMNGATHVAGIKGFIKKFETSIFSPESVVQLTIECPFPMLRGPSYVELAGVSGVTVPTPNLVDDLSTAPHGFKMHLTFTGTVPYSFTVQGKAGTTAYPFTINLVTSDPFKLADELYLSSEQDDKYLYMIRSGTITRLADTLAVNSIWPMMFPGETELEFSSSLVTINSITYRPHYWGV